MWRPNRPYRRLVQDIYFAKGLKYCKVIKIKNINPSTVDIISALTFKNNFNFEIDLEYAGLRGGDDFEFSKKRVESREKYYSGFRGNANSGNSIKINSEYGSITFK